MWDIIYCLTNSRFCGILFDFTLEMSKEISFNDLVFLYPDKHVTLSNGLVTKVACSHISMPLVGFEY